MTNEEERLIAECRIAVIGTSDFIDSIKTELQKSGFNHISIFSEKFTKSDTDSADIIAEYAGDGQSIIKEDMAVPIIYPFDFVDGAGAVVIMPGDDNELRRKDNMRLWSAEYCAGYCAFWNVEGCDWLMSALQAIKDGEKDTAALKTAALICARIATNIAVGRKVKHFPRFYLYSEKNKP